MITRTRICIALTCLALALAGCEGPQRSTPGVIVGENTIAIEQLALRLGLRIEQREDTFVIMKNAANTVIVFTQTDGRFFVNGKPEGSVGEVEKAGDTVYVRTALLDQIRPLLETALPQPSTVRPRRTTGLVIIDAGHGGKDPGTISATGLQEKTVNLRVAAKIARLLEQRGIGVVMTRWQDRYPELEDRAALANQRKADLFVSIHADSAPSTSARGFTVYVATAASAGSYRAAHAINQEMAGTGMENRGIREADYRVLVKTDCPAVLVELGYLSNAQDAALLADDTFRDRLAEAIADGIQTYLR